MRRIVLAIVGICVAWAATARADSPRVAASIKPVHSLVAGVMEGVGTPSLITHDAPPPLVELVFWIGPGIEGDLATRLSRLPGSVTIVELDRAPGVVLLPARGDSGIDGHIWLDPRNARAIVRAAAAALAQRDSANAPRYQENAAGLETRLAALDAELRETFFPLAGQPFAVVDDAYQYLERRYALNGLGAVPLDPTHLRASGARCIFGTPETRPSALAAAIAGTGIKTGTLDPIGAGQAAGPALYFGVLRGVARALSDCLGR